MKIVHVWWQLGYGGIETMLVNIANEQLKLGADVYIVVINDNNEEKLVASLDKRVHFICLGRRLKSHNPIFIYNYNKVLREIRPDVIHLHDSRFYTLILNRELSRIAVSTLHDLPKGSIRRTDWGHMLPAFLHFREPGNVLYINKIQKVFSISKAVRDNLKNKYGVESTVVYNGIKTHMFKQRPNTPCTNTLRIIMVSRLVHQKKGQDLLIEAVSKLKDKVDVTFVGEGESMDYLIKITADLGCNDYVHFIGKQSQSWIVEHMKDFDLFCQPSRWEGFGLTVAEAMAAKVPVLVSAGQGPAEVTCENKYGWTFKNGNIEDLARVISYIHTHYAEALDKAALAQTHVKENFDVSITAKKYLEMYKTTIQSMDVKHNMKKKTLKRLYPDIGN